MKLTLKIAAVAAILGFTGSAFAQSSATGIGTCGYRAGQIITLEAWPNAQDGANNTYLDFGTLVQANPANQSYAMVAPWMDHYTVGTNLFNFVQLNPAGDPPRSSRWHAHGEANAAFTITIPTDRLVLDAYTGAGVTLHSWNWAEISGESGTGATTGGYGATTTAFTSTGDFNFGIGGTLDMNANGPVNADLSATFPVTVNY